MTLRAWSGYADDKSEVGGEGLSAADNVSFTVEGEMRRRAGLTFFYATDPIVMSNFRSVVTGAWLAMVRSAGSMDAINLSTGTLTNLGSSYNVESRPAIAPVGQRIYFVNDFAMMKVWDGVSALADAGIEAPSVVLGAASTAAGSCTVGVHLIRYRYFDSKSPAGIYQSNPSPALSHTVASAAAGQLTFTVGASATDILWSTDPKVDTIQIEMTLVDGTTYYVATTCLNTATSVVVSISDDSLSQAVDQDATYGNFGHEQPPLGRCLFECRGHAFLCGATTRTRSLTVTNGSTTVTGTNLSLLVAGQLVRFGTDTKVYEIDSSGGTTVFPLTTVYTGTSGTYTATIYSKNPNRAYWSRPYMPESWYPSKQARDVLAGFGDAVVGGCDFQGDAWFFGSRSMARLVFPDDPANGEVNPVPGYHGLWNQRTLMPLDGVLYGWGPNGAWMISGGAPRWISRPIDATLADSFVDPTQSDDFFAAYDPVNKLIRWYFTCQGDTYPKYSATYDLTGQRWTIDYYRFGIDCATTIADVNGRVRLMVADATNSMVYYHEGENDGVPTSSNGAYTTSATPSTTTVIEVNESLPTGTGTDLTHLAVFRPATNETKIITSNTSSAITIPAFSTAPAVGENIYVGSITTFIRTDWWIGRDLSDKKRPHLHLLFNPSSTGSVEVRVYRDFTSTPATWTSNSDDRWADGVTVTDGATYFTVTLAGSTSLTDGFVSVPMPSDWGRAFRAEIACISPAGTMKLLDVRFAVDSGRDQGKETDE